MRSYWWVLWRSSLGFLLRQSGTVEGADEPTLRSGAGGWHGGQREAFTADRTSPVPLAPTERVVFSSTCTNLYFLSFTSYNEHGLTYLPFLQR